jgi:hypothetical protein
MTPKSTDIDFQAYLNKDNDEAAKELYISSPKLRIRYSSKQDFENIARHFGIMGDFKVEK